MHGVEAEREGRWSKGKEKVGGIVGAVRSQRQGGCLGKDGQIRVQVQAQAQTQEVLRWRW